ncbi:hypothetical protein SISSUDRAFT_1054722 [Sistotremastrum suecicum HHB10207 ss-3]|uniref:Uncharacterized protein n=1 Tax=Sistotremastrum suecicum HHB10207 ss-3 TaxID=1314776 RepID=A0A165Y988_9AGAM|nr:hypothetical protein SISSUDRAFT_1054722 [Sistotremastrum suecicum HHB10207 ss-3]
MSMPQRSSKNAKADMKRKSTLGTKGLESPRKRYKVFIPPPITTTTSTSAFASARLTTSKAKADSDSDPILNDDTEDRIRLPAVHASAKVGYSWTSVSVRIDPPNAGMKVVRRIDDTIDEGHDTTTFLNDRDRPRIGNPGPSSDRNKEGADLLLEVVMAKSKPRMRTRVIFAEDSTIIPSLNDSNKPAPHVSDPVSSSSSPFFPQTKTTIERASNLTDNASSRTKDAIVVPSSQEDEQSIPSSILPSLRDVFDAHASRKNRLDEIVVPSSIPDEYEYDRDATEDEGEVEGSSSRRDGGRDGGASILTRQGTILVEETIILSSPPSFTSRRTSIPVRENPRNFQPTRPPLLAFLDLTPSSPQQSIPNLDHHDVADRSDVSPLRPQMQPETRGPVPGLKGHHSIVPESPITSSSNTSFASNLQSPELSLKTVRDRAGREASDGPNAEDDTGEVTEEEEEEEEEEEAEEADENAYIQSNEEIPSSSPLHSRHPSPEPTITLATQPALDPETSDVEMEESMYIQPNEEIDASSPPPTASRRSPVGAPAELLRTRHPSERRGYEVVYPSDDAELAESLPVVIQDLPVPSHSSLPPADSHSSRSSRSVRPPPLSQTSSASASFGARSSILADDDVKKGANVNARIGYNMVDLREEEMIQSIPVIVEISPTRAPVPASHHNSQSTNPTLEGHEAANWPSSQTRTPRVAFPANSPTPLPPDSRAVSPLIPPSASPAVPELPRPAKKRKRRYNQVLQYQPFPPPPPPVERIRPRPLLPFFSLSELDVERKERGGQVTGDSAADEEIGDERRESDREAITGGGGVGGATKDVGGLTNEDGNIEHWAQASVVRIPSDLIRQTYDLLSRSIPQHAASTPPPPTLLQRPSQGPSAVHTSTHEEPEDGGQADIPTQEDRTKHDEANVKSKSGYSQFLASGIFPTYPPTLQPSSYPRPEDAQQRPSSRKTSERSFDDVSRTSRTSRTTRHSYASFTQHQKEETSRDEWDEDVSMEIGREADGTFASGANITEDPPREERSDVVSTDELVRGNAGGSQEDGGYTQFLSSAGFPSLRPTLRSLHSTAPTPPPPPSKPPCNVSRSIGYEEGSKMVVSDSEGEEDQDDEDEVRKDIGPGAGVDESIPISNWSPSPRLRQSLISRQSLVSSPSRNAEPSHQGLEDVKPVADLPDSLTSESDVVFHKTIEVTSRDQDVKMDSNPDALRQTRPEGSSVVDPADLAQPSTRGPDNLSRTSISTHGGYTQFLSTDPLLAYATPAVPTPPSQNVSKPPTTFIATGPSGTKSMYQNALSMREDTQMDEDTNMNDSRRTEESLHSQSKEISWSSSSHHPPPSSFLPHASSSKLKENVPSFLLAGTQTQTQPETQETQETGHSNTFSASCENSAGENSIHNFPHFTFNPSLITPLASLFPPPLSQPQPTVDANHALRPRPVLDEEDVDLGVGAGGRGGGAKKRNLVVAILDWMGPEYINIKKGPSAGMTIARMTMTVGDDSYVPSYGAGHRETGATGTVMEIVVWRETAEEWCEMGVKKGDVILLENISYTLKPPSAADPSTPFIPKLTASPNLKPLSKVLYRTFPTGNGFEKDERKLRPDLRLGQSDAGVRMVGKIVRWITGVIGTSVAKMNAT